MVFPNLQSGSLVPRGDESLLQSRALVPMNIAEKQVSILVCGLS